MSKVFHIVQKTIVRAPNMMEAKKLAGGTKGFGELLGSETFVEEENSLPADIKHSEFTSFEDEEEEYEDDHIAIGYESTHFTGSHPDFLRAENKRLARLADKYKNVRDEAVKAVYSAAYDAFASFELPKGKKAAQRNLKNGNVAETAVAVLADWQLGKVTPDYDSDVLAQRMDLYTDKLIEMTEIQRSHHPVNNLHVWLLGDIVEGEEIFPGQSFLIDSGIYRQVGVNGPEVLSTFLSRALEHFDHVHVTGVIGNHGAVGGRSRKMYDPETNMDRLLYKIVSLIFANEGRVSFDIPDGRGERNWYAVDTIGNYSTLLIHGDQLPHPSSVNSVHKAVMGWKDGAIPEHFDDVFMGHYHQQFKITIGSTMLRVSGSPESYNTYAQERFYSMSRPCQHLMFVHPDRGVTSEYSIWLDGA
jgi:hypothetical protein